MEYIFSINYTPSVLENFIESFENFVKNPNYVSITKVKNDGKKVLELLEFFLRKSNNSFFRFFENLYLRRNPIMIPRKRYRLPNMM